VPLKIDDFVGSVQMLAWAKDNGCHWLMLTCGHIVGGGKLEVLQWTRAQGCLWDLQDLENLVDPDQDCCARAAEGGHLEVLKWLRENGCPWGQMTCEGAALAGAYTRSLHSST
jgi:hypothetical protein